METLSDIPKLIYQEVEMLKYITVAKAMTLAHFAEKVNLRPRNAQEQARRIESTLDDEIDSIASDEFKLFYISIYSLSQNEVNELYALISLARGEFFKYEDAIERVIEISPGHKYLVMDIVNISSYIKQGILMAKF